MFRLLRYFSITSALGVLAVVAGLLFFYRHLAFHALMEQETRSNLALTQVFANHTWPEYAAFLADAGRMDREELARRPEIGRLRQDLLREMRGLPIVKVKIYDLQGLTVFSTDPAQIGEDKRGNPGVRSAMAGKAVSDITFRHRMDAFEQVIFDRSVVSSYLPIRRDEAEPVEAVFEVYSDVSDLVGRLERTQWQVAAAVLGSLALLYFFLFLIVRRADRILRAQSEEERLAHRETLHHQAFHDALTGLPNRAQLDERLAETIRRAQRNGSIFALLFVDLDHFKTINESLGHQVGDELLRAVSERLRDCLPEAGTLARLGGDEFIMLVPELSRMEQAARVADKLREAIAGQPYEIQGRELRITSSIGIAVYPDDGDSGVELIKNADAAMYHAKGLGRNNHQFFTHDLNARAFAVLSMERSLRQALEREEFLLHFQPQIELATGLVVGAEALVRWRHPEMGLVPPMQFIPIAEERGLIVPLGQWVLRTACRQARAWQDAGLPAITVAVNVSAVQFRQADFAAAVAAILGETGLAPQYLELELTESVLMDGAAAAAARLEELKAMGVKLSIDDFGTGYSSLNYLKQFCLDKLKLDRSFVRGLPDDANDLAITAAVLGMAKALRLKVVAEGVEAEEQLQILRLYDCDEVQGFHFSKPLPAEDFRRFLAERDSRWPQALTETLGA